MKSRSLVDFSIGVNKFHVTVRYEDFQKLKIIFNGDFSRHVVCSVSDFLILNRVSGPLGGPAISYPLSGFKLRYRYTVSILIT